jgi:hypothetical protein
MPAISADKLSGAHLALIHEVFVQAGRFQDGQNADIWCLTIDKMPAAVKPSRVSDLQLHVNVDAVDDGVLEDIKQKLASNQTLSNSRQAILDATWVKREFKVSQLP